MIEIYQGRIGGGKTYAAVAAIARHLAHGGTVYTNIDIVQQGMANLIARRYGKVFNANALLRLPEKVHGWQDFIKWGVRELDVLVVIDEAQVFYNSRDWSRTQNEHGRMLSFLTQSRKACVSVIFITQHMDNIDKQFRLLAQNIWIFRDMAKFGPLAPLMGGAFLAVAVDYTGERLSSKLVWKSRSVFKAYDTLSFLDEQMQQLAEELREGIQPYRLESASFLARLGFRAKYVKRTDETDSNTGSAGSPRVAGVGQVLKSLFNALRQRRRGRASDGSSTPPGVETPPRSTLPGSGD